MTLFTSSSDLLGCVSHPGPGRLPQGVLDEGVRVRVRPRVLLRLQGDVRGEEPALLLLH